MEHPVPITLSRRDTQLQALVAIDLARLWRSAG
jgi:hypothetical protein